jgi:hypothetical protein
LLDYDRPHRPAGLLDVLREPMAIEAFAPERQQQSSPNVGMRAQRVHHAVCIRVRVAAAEADQVNGLALESIHDLARYVVCTLHEIGDNDAVPDAFSSVTAEKTLQYGRVI